MWVREWFFKLFSGYVVVRRTVGAAHNAVGRPPWRRAENKVADFLRDEAAVDNVRHIVAVHRSHVQVLIIPGLEGPTLPEVTGLRLEGRAAWVYAAR